MSFRGPEPPDPHVGFAELGLRVGAAGFAVLRAGYRGFAGSPQRLPRDRAPGPREMRRHVSRRESTPFGVTVGVDQTR